MGNFYAARPPTPKVRFQQLGMWLKSESKCECMKGVLVLQESRVVGNAPEFDHVRLAVAFC
jgi:hypothetical protein